MRDIVVFVEFSLGILFISMFEICELDWVLSDVIVFDILSAALFIRIIETCGQDWVLLDAVFLNRIRCSELVKSCEWGCLMFYNSLWPRRNMDAV